MAVSGKFYGKSFLSAYNKELDIDSDALKIMLTTVTYVPDQDAHQYKSSVTNEVSGTGYTAGGITLTSVAITYTGATNVLAIDAADVSWTTATFTARIAVVYDSTPATDATRPLIGYIDFGADQSPSAGTLSIVFDSSGIATVTVS